MFTTLKRLTAVGVLAILTATTGITGCSADAASAAAAAVGSAERKEITVYLTQSGKKYHRDGCRHLSRSRIAIPLSRAVREYDPCKVCRPPR